MKNSRLITYKKDGHTLCKFLLLTAFYNGKNFSKLEREHLRKRVSKYCIDRSSMVFQTENILGSGKKSITINFYS